MDTREAISSLLELRENETILQYFYERHINTQEEKEREKALQILFSSKDAYTKTGNDPAVQSRYLFADDTMPKGQRLGLFLHPRFLPDTLHAHDYFEMKYSLQGDSTIQVGRQVFMLKERSLCILAPDIPHKSLVFDTQTLLINIAIRNDTIKESFPRIFETPNFMSDFFQMHSYGNTPPMLVFPDKQSYFQDLILCAYIAEEDREKHPFAMYLCETYIEQVLLNLLLQEEPKELSSMIPQNESKILFEILTYMQKNLATVSLSELADKYHFSKAYLSRYLKKSTGKSFQELLSNYRLSEASRLLLSTDWNVDDIMSAIGYAGRTNFYKIFEARYGKTPSDYRHFAYAVDTSGA